ncbi:MAG: FAD-binding oxidoreductase [Candidatus Azobacteroides sp.]|nr:FAD-binding oxidoreductase [Candidatus Azobacteroides sp.]
MELYAGLPYWIAKNPLYNYYHPLERDEETDVVIIGSGITGSLVAHELCQSGIECAVVDKRSISTGSSIASTALLQYEIDTPLSELAKMLNEDIAVKAYQACLQSIKDLKQVFSVIGYDPGFEQLASVFYASNARGLRMIEKEFNIRKKHQLPVRFLSGNMVKEKYGIHTPGALENDVSAQMDPYAGATHLLDHHMRKNQLKIYSHTEIKTWQERNDGYVLVTTEGKILKCKYVVVAAGFEAAPFLPEKVMKLTSTYAIISQPLDEKYIWEGHALLWETHNPYLYIRTDSKNRILVGGEDIDFKNPVLRDRLLRKKVRVLEKKFNKLFPDIPFVTEMTWCGTFSSTKDGLPFIGSWPGKDRMLYALGYGGNGITFSMIAAQLIRNKIKGVKDDRELVFGFERMK